MKRLTPKDEARKMRAVFNTAMRWFHADNIVRTKGWCDEWQKALVERELARTQLREVCADAARRLESR